MRTLVCLSLVLAFACTKHNPEACCSSADQCTSFGLSGITPCEGTQVCNSSGACVAPMCTTNADCTDPSAPLCVDQLCVAAQCTTNADCTDSTMPFCENDVCVAACGSNADCTMAGEPYCAPTGACVGCLDDSACSGNTPVCDGSAHACRGCEADAECTSNVCLQSTGTCADPSSIVYVAQAGTDSGDCSSAASPCATLPYAFSKLNPKNVVKILSGSYSVTGTLPVEISGFIEGTMTTLSGGGSGGIFEIDGDNVTISNMTIDATGTLKMAANVKAGLLTLFDVTLESDIEVDGGQLAVDRSTVENVDCGQNGSASEGGIVQLSRSQLIAVTATGCNVTLEQNTIDQTSQPNNDPMITLSGGKYTVENNTVISNNSFTDPVSLFTAPDGSVFRFNTLVNLSGENQTATPLACDGTATNVTDNIIAWNTSAQPQCATTYTLYDQFEALPPGAGNQVGSNGTFFVNMANKDFHLATGSPAINAAQPGSCISVDHDGNLRGSACDVGAFEAP